MEKLEKKIKELNLEEKIFLAGEVEKEDVKDYYAAGDIFVYASKSETQGMIISEAMYMGLPIVAVKSTGVEDLVEDGISGFLVQEENVKFSEAVEKLVNDEKLRGKISDQGKRIVHEKYTAKICTQKLLVIYERLIKDLK